MDEKTCAFCHEPIERHSIRIKYAEYDGYFCDRPICERAAWELRDEDRANRRQLLRGGNRCIFDVAWRDYCGEFGWPACENHRGLCMACKKNLAIRECSSASSFVCGQPLCKSCRCPSHGC